MEQQLWAIVETEAYEYGAALWGILRGTRQQAIEHMLALAKSQAEALDEKSWPKRAITLHEAWPDGGFCVELDLGPCASRYWQAQPFAPVDACANP